MHRQYLLCARMKEKKYIKIESNRLKDRRHIGDKIYIANGIEPLKKSPFCRGLIVVIVGKETVFGKIKCICGIDPRMRN
jgi:hypothetical protein